LNLSFDSPINISSAVSFGFVQWAPISTGGVLEPSREWLRLPTLSFLCREDLDVENAPAGYGFDSGVYKHLPVRCSKRTSQILWPATPVNSASSLTAKGCWTLSLGTVEHGILTVGHGRFVGGTGGSRRGSRKGFGPDGQETSSRTSRTENGT